MPTTLDDIFPPAKFLISPPPRPADRHLRELASDANVALQQIQDLAGREPREAAEVRFPRGYLVEIGRWRLALPFVRSNDVRSMVADALMMHDVQSWLLKRTDLSGHARGMLVKSCIASLGSVAEALVIDATSPPMGKRQKMSSRIEKLRESTVIDEQLASDLSWLWDIRNRQHLHALTEREFDVYTRDDHPRAESTVARLVIALRGGSAAPVP